MKSFAAAAITTIGTSLAAAAIIAFLPAPVIGAEPEATKPSKVMEIMKPVVSKAGKAPIALSEAELDRVRGARAHATVILEWQNIAAGYDLYEGSSTTGSFYLNP